MIAYLKTETVDGEYVLISIPEIRMVISNAKNTYCKVHVPGFGIAVNNTVQEIQEAIRLSATDFGIEVTVITPAHHDEA